MAVHWKMTDEFSSNNSEIPEALKAKLMIIDCPILGSKDDWWLKEILFSSSEYHLDFMQWILTNFSKSLETFFNSKQSNLDSPQQVQTQRLLTVCSDLGLCHKRDKDIIQGTATFTKQVQFWNKLIDAFILKNRSTAKLNQNLILNDNRVNSFTNDLLNHPNLDSPFSNDCSYLSMLCNLAGNKQGLFQTSHGYLPSDIKLQGSNSNHSGFEVPSLNALTEMLATVTLNVDKEKLKINDLQSQRPYDLEEIVEEFNSTIVTEKITEVLSDLGKMAYQFTQCHEELKPWLNASRQPKLSNLGVKFEDACSKLEEFTNALNDLTVLKENYNSVCETEASLRNEDNFDNYGDFIDTTEKNILKLSDNSHFHY